MFKWVCLGVASVFLLAVLWIVNDIRLQVRRSVTVVRDAGENVNEHLPELVARTKATTEVLSRNLPVIVEKVRTSTDTVSETLPEVVERVDRTTEVVADVAEDIRQLRELLGGSNTKRDANILAYTNSLLKLVESSGGTISDRTLLTKKLKNPRPAADWVATKRGTYLLYRLARAKSKKDMLDWIGKGVYIEVGKADAVPLADWLKEHHPESKNLQ